MIYSSRFPSPQCRKKVSCLNPSLMSMTSQCEVNQIKVQSIQQTIKILDGTINADKCKINTKKVLYLNICTTIFIVSRYATSVYRHIKWEHFNYSVCEVFFTTNDPSIKNVTGFRSSILMQITLVFCLSYLTCKWLHWINI